MASAEIGSIIEALGAREVIARAVGLLMAHRGVSEAKAHEILVRDAADSDHRCARSPPPWSC